MFSNAPPRDDTREDRRPALRRALFSLRLAIGGWLMFWGVAGLDGAARGRVLFAELPHTTLSDGQGVFVATLEIAAAGLVALGLLRPISYVAAFFLQALATFAIYRMFLTPFQGDHLLFAANIPLLVAHGVLYALRGDDTLLAADSLLGRLTAHLTSSQSSTTSASSPVV